MKQHITKSQWDELDKDQKAIFHDLTKHKHYPKIPHLSIGQMIEFLNTKHTVQIEQWMDHWRHWRVGLDWRNGDEFAYVVEKPELCDALWEAVKEIL